MAEVVIRNNNIKVYVTQPSVLESVQVIQGPSGPPGASGVVQSIVPGSNITVDSADPANPVVSASGGSAVATTFTPVGNIAANNVQAALEELDAEKETPAGAQAKVDALANAAARGGVYSSPAGVNLAYNTAYEVPLSTTSGDALASSGRLVIPTGGAGIWLLSATWAAYATNDTGTRAFLDVKLNDATGLENMGTWRSSLPKSEDRASVTTSLRLADGDNIKCVVFWQTAPSAGTPHSYVRLDAYRIGN